MQLSYGSDTSIPLLDVAPFLEYYNEKGLSTDLLSSCNSMQFKFIDGAGCGYFLVNKKHYSMEPTLTFTVKEGASELVRTVDVLEVTEINLPTMVPSAYVLKVVEPKYDLYKLSVDRNYNVIDRKYQISATAPILPPDDAVKKTFREIIEDFTGYSVNYNVSANYYLYDVFIQGMSQLEAIDKMCAAMGYLWTYDSGDITIWDVNNSVNPSNLSLVYLKDIADQKIDPPLRHVTFAFPVLDCCVQTPDNMKTVIWNGSSVPGDGKRVFMPYYPAIIDYTGALVNSSLMNSTADTLRTNYQAVMNLENSYFVHPGHRYYDIHGKRPESFYITYSDYGNGPETSLSARDYPFIQLPDLEVKDRTARNWIGHLLQGYLGDVDGFWVVPEFGIDGRIPEGNQYVINLYNWDFGAINAKVRIEWDCYNYRWIPLQQEYVCPNGDAPAQDPPPDPIEYPSLVFTVP